MLRCLQRKQKDHPADVDAPALYFTESLKKGTYAADVKQSLQTAGTSMTKRKAMINLQLITAIGKQHYNAVAQTTC